MNKNKSINNFQFFSNLGNKEIELFIFANKSKEPSKINQKFLSGFPEIAKDLELNYLLISTTDIQYDLTVVQLEVTHKEEDKQAFFDYQMFCCDEKRKMYNYISNINRIFNNVERNILMMRRKDKYCNFEENLVDWISKN